MMGTQGLRSGLVPGAPRPVRSRAGGGAGTIAVFGVAAVTAVAAGAAVAAFPMVAAGILPMVLVGALVWVRPHVAGYLVIAITPLVAGIDRGTLLPLMRPNEALAVFLVVVLVMRGVTRLPADRLPRITLHPVEWAIVLLALASSVVPVLWLTLRGQSLTADDVSHALVLWKYLGVYSLVRLTVTTQDHVRRCLQLLVLAAVIVAVVAILQVMDLFGVRAMLATLYAPFGHEAAIELPRASSTLSLPAATADLLIFNLLIVLGMYFIARRNALLYGSAASLFVVGVFAAGEFSSALGLLVAVICVAVALRATSLLVALPPVAGLAILAMWPVVAERLQGFESVHGLPESWIGRLYNLQTYFWPELLSGANMLLGVRPSARVAVNSQVLGFVWIESGYTWLLWGGGIPLLLAFGYFVVTTFKLTTAQLRVGPTYTRVAALATLGAVVVISALMLFDPHLTYRGSADCFFALLALTLTTRARGDPTELKTANHDSAETDSCTHDGRERHAA